MYSILMCITILMLEIGLLFICLSKFSWITGTFWITIVCPNSVGLMANFELLKVTYSFHSTKIVMEHV